MPIVPTIHPRTESRDFCVCAPRVSTVYAHRSPPFAPGLGHVMSVSEAPRVSTVLQPEGKDHLRTVTGDKPKLESQLYSLPLSTGTLLSEPRFLICT